MVFVWVGLVFEPQIGGGMPVVEEVEEVVVG